MKSRYYLLLSICFFTITCTFSEADNKEVNITGFVYCNDEPCPKVVVSYPISRNKAIYQDTDNNGFFSISYSGLLNETFNLTFENERGCQPIQRQIIIKDYYDKLGLFEKIGWKFKTPTINITNLKQVNLNCNQGLPQQVGG